MQLNVDLRGSTKYLGCRMLSSRITIVTKTKGSTGDLSKIPALFLATA
jgi:hypothetical protein